MSDGLLHVEPQNRIIERQLKNVFQHLTDNKDMLDHKDFRYLKTKCTFPDFENTVRLSVEAGYLKSDPSLVFVSIKLDYWEVIHNGPKWPKNRN